ncbi:class II fructose-bisphosphate aldolase [Streptomyces sp. NPDC051684]|uniref:class II fructose-bisphosphate aldolase n=1 Tax=Streptomyces sp. NPDC051684 TaxID=3365670 RepID=UPI00379B3FE3
MDHAWRSIRRPAVGCGPAGPEPVPRGHDHSPVTSTDVRLEKAQYSERTARALGPPTVSAVFRAMAGKSQIPAALHPDHCQSLEFAEECLRSSWQSVLYDASGQPYEIGLDATSRLVGTARKLGADIEGEFETIGRAAIPDRTPPHGIGRCVEFIEKTDISCFSPDIGTQHGDCPNPPEIDTRKLAGISEAADVPLVVHGASGLAPERLARLATSAELGVGKVNFSTTLKHAHWAATVAFASGTGQGATDPLQLHHGVRELVSGHAVRCIETVNSAGRAHGRLRVRPQSRPARLRDQG